MGDVACRHTGVRCTFILGRSLDYENRNMDERTLKFVLTTTWLSTHTHIHTYTYISFLPPSFLPAHLHSTSTYSYHDSFSSTHLSRRSHSAYIYLLFSFLGVVNGTTIEGFIPFRLHDSIAFVHIYREKKGWNPCPDPSWSGQQCEHLGHMLIS